MGFLYDLKSGGSRASELREVKDGSTYSTSLFLIKKILWVGDVFNDLALA